MGPPTSAGRSLEANQPQLTPASPPAERHEEPGSRFGAPGTYHSLNTTPHRHIFSTPRNDSPAVISRRLFLAGDIESNPGPNHKYTCPTCLKPITSSRQTKGSVLCNSCGNWTHFTCTTLASKKHYTNTWTCSSCPNLPPKTPLLPTPPTPPPPPPSPPPPPPNHLPAAAPNTHRTHNINILQLNIDGINTKKQELTHFIKQHNIHIAILQETKLQRTQKHQHSKTSPPSGRTGTALAAVDSSPWYTNQSITQTPVRTPNPSFPHRITHKKYNQLKCVLETNPT